MTTKLTWLGHGTWLVEGGGSRILVDPFLDDSPTAAMKSDQVSADFILVSHGHFDHIADAVKIANRTGATVVSNFEICQWLAAQGVEKTHAMNLGGGHDFRFGRLKQTIAFHSSSLPDGSYGGEPSGFLLTLDGRKIYLACDTALFSDMRHIGAAGLDAAVLPVGDNFTMGPDDFIEATRLLQPAVVLPSHYNTWPLIAQDSGVLTERIRRETQSEPVVLQPGQTYDLGS